MPGRMKSVIQKETIQRGRSPMTRNFQPSRPCEVRRLDQGTTFLVCEVFLLSFQAVMLLTKTAIHHCFLLSILK